MELTHDGRYFVNAFRRPTLWNEEDTFLGVGKITFHYFCIVALLGKTPVVVIHMLITGKMGSLEAGRRTNLVPIWEDWSKAGPGGCPTVAANRPTWCPVRICQWVRLKAPSTGELLAWRFVTGSSRWTHWSLRIVRPFDHGASSPLECERSLPDKKTHQSTCESRLDSSRLSGQLDASRFDRWCGSLLTCTCNKEPTLCTSARLLCAWENRIGQKP